MSRLRTTTSVLFDSYSRTARLAPAILAVLPALAVLAAGVSSQSTGLRVGGFVGGCVGLVVVALVRDRGRHVQEHLWRGWGGSPTARRLRWREGREAEVARLHDRVERATGLSLPDAEEEARDPENAEARYDEAGEALRALTRDQARFNLLFKENVNYGWRRNCYGLRPAGIAVAALTIVGTACVLALAGGAFPSRAARWMPALAASALALAWWSFVVSERWVRTAAELYADRLYEATHTLAPEAQQR
jgi:hypothetical protein